MTRKEFNEFTNKLFIAFPSYLSLLKANSPNQGGTMLVWFDVLKHVEIDDASRILQSWLDGRKEAPKSYEYDRIHFIIRDLASALKSERHKESESERRAREKQEANGTRRALQGLGIDEAYLRGVSLKQRVDSGEMSVYEFNEQLAKIVQEVA